MTACFSTVKNGPAGLSDRRGVIFPVWLRYLSFSFAQNAFSYAYCFFSRSIAFDIGGMTTMIMHMINSGSRNTAL